MIRQVAGHPVPQGASGLVPFPAQVRFPHHYSTGFKLDTERSRRVCVSTGSSLNWSLGVFLLQIEILTAYYTIIARRLQTKAVDSPLLTALARTLQHLPW